MTGAVLFLYTKRKGGLIYTYTNDRETDGLSGYTCYIYNR